jgi:hypothetical protein
LTCMKSKPPPTFSSCQNVGTTKQHTQEDE